MASKIKAINTLRPRIKLSRTVKMDDLVQHIANHTGLNKGEIMLVLLELHDAIIFFNHSGQGVKLEGLGTYLPNLRLDGTVDVHYRQDPQLRKGLNKNNFRGTVVNRKNIGKTPDELVALWDEAHPDDPVE